MSRSRLLCLALGALCALPAAGQVLPGPSPTPVLPLASIENWSVLLLEGGILYTRVEGLHDAPYFVFATAGASGSTEFLAYRGGSDVAGALGSLQQTVSLASKDVALLKAFALGVSLDPASFWDALTFGDAYLIAADPDLGQAGPRLHSFLVVLEAAGFASRMVGLGSAASSKDAIVVKAGICDTEEWTAWESTLAGGVVVGSATGSGSGSFPKVAKVSSTTEKAFATAANSCGGVIAGVGDPPAFPILTPPAYPTAPPPGTVFPWTGSPCAPVGAVTASGCMQNPSGNYCTQCTCSVTGSPGGRWTASGNCNPVTIMPVGSPCGPNGGRGPCTSGGKTCDCTCTGGSWTCGSREIAALFLLLAAAFAWRRRIAC